MKMSDIKKKAKSLGIKVGIGSKKADLIRAIQTAEGNTACFGSGDKSCPHMDCCWRTDCIPVD